MAVVQLLISATKLAGVIVTLSVAANAFSFARFRRKFLRPFPDPIARHNETLADFNEEHGDEENRDFFFGLATAPAHVEDGLSDAWLEFAEQKNPSEDEEASSSSSLRHRNVAAWHNVPRPEERLRFWSDPDSELKLARDTGVTVFRMGIDWSRIVPFEPQDNLHDNVNYAALERYKWIMERVHSYGMKVMLTLFHHSLPSWAAEYGGWKLERTVDHFIDFTRVVVESVSELVDYWVTFNEPHVFAMLTYSAGTWPGRNPGVLEAVTSVLPTGVFQQAMHWMAVAHLKAYDIIHKNSVSQKPRSMVGVAHHVSFMRPYGLFDIAAVSLATSLTVFPYVDAVSEKLDFVGINYYGQEVVCAGGLKLVERDEYSESGRGVYPDGLFRMLLEFHERYKHLKVPFMVTENGVSDDTDLIRQPYLVEHLLAVFAAMAKGVPVLGYMFWTISDNWEWADGYGPKFGLVAVDRANDLARKPRPSYHLFTKIARSGKVTRQDRAVAWNKLRRAVKEKKTRPFYREVNKFGFMYSAGLDEPIERRYVDRDWRFGHYEMEGLQDPLNRFLRLLARPLFLFWKKTRHEEEEEVPLVLEPQM